MKTATEDFDEKMYLLDHKTALIDQQIALIDEKLKLLEQRTVWNTLAKPPSPTRRT